MATFRDLPSGRTQAVIRLNGKSQSKTFPSREQAEAWADKIEVKERATQIRLSVVMDTYLSMFMKNRGGYDRFEHIHKVILKAMGNKEIRKLTPEDICKFRDRRVAKVAGSTARLECQQLSRLLKHARIHHKIDTSERGVSIAGTSVQLTYCKYRLPPTRKGNSAIFAGSATVTCSIDRP